MDRETLEMQDFVLRELGTLVSAVHRLTAEIKFDKYDNSPKWTRDQLLVMQGHIENQYKYVHQQLEAMKEQKE